MGFKEINEIKEIKEAREIEHEDYKKQLIEAFERYLKDLKGRISDELYQQICNIKNDIFEVIDNSYGNDYPEFLLNLKVLDLQNFINHSNQLLSMFANELGIEKANENKYLIPKSEENLESNKMILIYISMLRHQADYISNQSEESIEYTEDSKYRNDTIKYMNGIFKFLYEDVKEKDLFVNQKSKSSEKKLTQPIIIIEFENQADLIAKFSKLDKSKVKKLTLKCTGKDVVEDISMEGFDNLRSLSIDNCSVILKDDDGNDKKFCNDLKNLNINNSNIRSWNNLDDVCSNIIIKDSIISFSSARDIKAMVKAGIKESESIKLNNCKFNAKMYSRTLDEFFCTHPKIDSLESISKISGLSEDEIIVHIAYGKNVQFCVDDIYSLHKFKELKKRHECISSDGIFADDNGNFILSKDTFEYFSNHSIKTDWISENLQVKISDVSQLTIEQLEKLENIFNKIVGIQICPEKNNNIYMHTNYTVEQYKKCRKVIDNILNDIDEVDSDRSNELDVFLQVYRKLGELISYDYEAAGNKSIRGTMSRNLEGGLLRHESVCAGYAEILRNVLSCKGIECICIGNDKGLDDDDGHEYNQVKINGKWYYVDLTWDADKIKSEEELVNCLLSEEEFVKKGNDYHNDGKSEQKYEALESFDKQVITDTIKLQKDRKIQQEKRTTYGINRLVNMLKEYGMGDYEDLQINYDDRNSIKFEKQMLEIGKCVGIISTETDLESLELDRISDNDRTTMLIYYSNFMAEKYYKKSPQSLVSIKESLLKYYDKMGIKSSDLTEMLNLKKKQLVNHETKEEKKVEEESL